MKNYATYQVTTRLQWCCPGQLLFVKDGMVIGYQTHPTNDLTRYWVEEGQEWEFVPEDYTRCERVG